MGAMTSVMAVFLLLWFGAGMVAGAVKHADLVGSYEGTKTCGACHEKAVKDVTGSLHYQQLAEPQFLKGWEKGKLAGMMVSY